MYYKLGQVLQIRAIITNWSIIYAQVVTDDVEKTTEERVSCVEKDLQPGNGEKTIELAEIKSILLQHEKLRFFRIQSSPPVRASNDSTSKNTSNISENMFNLDFLSLQDEYLVNILEELQNKVEVLGHNITKFKNSNRIKGPFYSDNIFNFSHRVLSDAVIKKT